MATADPFLMEIALHPTSNKLLRSCAWGRTNALFPWTDKLSWVNPKTVAQILINRWLCNSDVAMKIMMTNERLYIYILSTTLLDITDFFSWFSKWELFRLMLMPFDVTKLPPLLFYFFYSLFLHLMNCDSNMLNSLALESLHILQSSWDKEKKYIYKWKKLPFFYHSY